MEKFTFVLEFRKGTYIQQIVSESLELAIHKWAEMIDTFSIPGIGDKEKSILRKELATESISKIRGIDNVWCLFLRLKRSYLLVNIIATK